MNGRIDELVKEQAHRFARLPACAGNDDGIGREVILLIRLNGGDGPIAWLTCHRGQDHGTGGPPVASELTPVPGSSANEAMFE